MLIYLMRHGEAVHPSEWGRSDDSRPLTSLGEAQLETATKDMARLRFSAAALLTSPFVRARQTSDIIQNQIPSLKPVVVPELSAGASLATLKSVVQKYISLPSIWMVGHMPDLGTLGSRLTSEAYLLEKGFQPAEIWAIETDLSAGNWGGGRFLWSRGIMEWSKLKAL